MPGIKLNHNEIDKAFGSDAMRRDFPPIIDTQMAARLLCVPRKTIYAWAARGRLDGTYRRRGKKVLFWRDRLIDRIFNGPDWPEEKKDESKQEWQNDADRGE